LLENSRMTAGRSVLSALVALVAMLCGDASMAQTQRSEKAAKTATPAANEEHPLPPPIAFFIATGEPGACGPGCGEWIAADGTIDRAAAQRFRALLDRLGKRKLPVYFHSPGGSVTAAMEIGHLLRTHRMTAGVARTIPRGCDPLSERESACDTLKRSGRELPSEMRTARTMCNSSCVYALIGATVREVTAGALVGVHSIALARYDENGVARAQNIATPSAVDAAKLRSVNAQLEKYIVAMGVDRGLFAAASAIKHERLRFISRDEVARFGIDRREFHESRWMSDEGPPGPLSVVKFVTEANGVERKQYRTMRFRLTCGRSSLINVQFDRELASSDKPVSIAVMGPASDLVLAASKAKPTSGYNDIEMESRFARVTASFFEDAAKSDTIELVEAPDISALDKPPRRVKLSTAGLSSAIGALSQRCR
jgi:hypothetical protein